VRQRQQREEEQAAELGAEVARIGQALELLQARHVALAERVDRMTGRSVRNRVTCGTDPEGDAGRRDN